VASEVTLVWARQLGRAICTFEAADLGPVKTGFFSFPNGTRRIRIGRLLTCRIENRETQYFTPPHGCFSKVEDVPQPVAGDIQKLTGSVLAVNGGITASCTVQYIEPPS
jgi:hypothetical protein